MNEIKALTLWQPWGSLIMWGEKRYETRSWRTDYRGPLAIHAGMSSDARELYELHALYRQVLDRRNGGWCGLPAGAVLGIVELLDCVPTASRTGMLPDHEEAFGDWSAGRWAWKLRVLEVFDQPIKCVGAQGLWTWRRPTP